MGLLAGPLLVAGAATGPDVHSGAVSGASANHIEAEAGLATDDGAVGVEGPLLIGAAVAVPDLHPGTRRCGMTRYVQALVTIDLQLAVGEGGPLLIRATVAIVDAQQRPIGRGRPWHVKAAVRAYTTQDSSRTTTTTTTTAAGSHPSRTGVGRGQTGW